MVGFKEKLQSGAAVSGPIVSEIRTVGPIKALALAGHDFVWLDMEHAMFGWETIQTWIMGVSPPFTSPLVQSAPGARSPATRPLGVKHRLSWMCHCISFPPTSGVLASVVPGSAMNMAATNVFLPLRISNTSDSG